VFDSDRASVEEDEDNDEPGTETEMDPLARLWPIYTCDVLGEKRTAFQRRLHWSPWKGEPLLKGKAQYSCHP